MSVWYQRKTCLRIVGIIVEQYDSFKRKGGIYGPRRVSRPILCEVLHPHVHILRDKSIQKAVDNEDSKESRSRVASGFYSENAKKKADIRTNTYFH